MSRQIKIRAGLAPMFNVTVEQDAAEESGWLLDNEQAELVLEAWVAHGDGQNLHRTWKWVESFDMFLIGWTTSDNELVLEYWVESDEGSFWTHGIPFPHSVVPVPAAPTTPGSVISGMADGEEGLFGLTPDGDMDNLPWRRMTPATGAARSFTPWYSAKEITVHKVEFDAGKEVAE